MLLIESMTNGEYWLFDKNEEPTQIFTNGKNENLKLLSRIYIGFTNDKRSNSDSEELMHREFINPKNKILAYVPESGELVINDMEVLKAFLETPIEPLINRDNFYTIKEYVFSLSQQGIIKKESTVRNKIFRGQLHGAVRVGKDWFVPKDTPWPKDNRKKGI